MLRDGTRLPVSDLGLRFTADDDGGWTITGGSRLLDLAAVRDLLTPLPRLLPGTLDRLDLDAIRPGGGLHDRSPVSGALPPSWPRPR